MKEMLETPYFIINKEEFDNSVKQLNNAITKYWCNTIVGYSVKSNTMLWVLNYMEQQNFYAEVVSDDEYSIAKLCGFPIDRIIYNGIAKEEASFKEAVENGAIVNIDSWREIRWISELPNSLEKNIGIRINFDLESMSPGITAGGKEGSRFGFSLESGELGEAINMLKEIPHTNIVGIHMHNSIPSRSLDAYCAMAKEACFVAKEMNLSLSYVNIGGGFFGGLKNKPNYNNYFAVITDVLSESFDKKRTALIVEPGMSILSSAISYVTSVVDVKKTIYNNFIVTDGGRTHIDPLFRKSSYFYEILANDYNKREVITKQVIVGFTCVEGDRLFVLNNKPQLKEGDRIIYHNIGAYTYTSASNFIKFLPAIYEENKNGIRKVYDKWTAVDFINKQSVK